MILRVKVANHALIQLSTKEYGDFLHLCQKWKIWILCEYIDVSFWNIPCKSFKNFLRSRDEKTADKYELPCFTCKLPRPPFCLINRGSWIWRPELLACFILTEFAVYHFSFIYRDYGICYHFFILCYIAIARYICTEEFRIAAENGQCSLKIGHISLERRYEYFSVENSIIIYCFRNLLSGGTSMASQTKK